MRLGTCIHFTGLDIGRGYKTQCCKAGVNFFETFDGRRVGMFYRMPCVEFVEKPAKGRGTVIRAGEPTIREEMDRKGETVMPCLYRVEPTDEQVQSYRRDQDDHLEKTFAGLRLANEWRVIPKPDEDRAEVVECPVFKGRLHLHQSARNGHTMGKCETEGCVAWIE